MEFTLESIKKLHEKFTGVDFPILINEFKKIGMIENEFNLDNGTITYKHINGTKLENKTNMTVTISVKSSKENAKEVLVNHQLGKTDFPTFCQQIAQAGVCKWIINTTDLTCSYYDLSNNPIIIEKIPKV